MADWGEGVLTLCGELDLAMATTVRRRLDRSDGDVTLNCARLSFMDAAGINLFFDIDRLCLARGARMMVVNAPICVTRLLALVELDGVFDVRSQDPVI